MVAEQVRIAVPAAIVEYDEHMRMSSGRAHRVDRRLSESPFVVCTGRAAPEEIAPCPIA